MYELVKLDDELGCMCELWRALEVITSGAEISLSPSTRVVELVVVWAEAWTNGKGARACAYCQKGETECKLKACVKCKTVKYCSKPCQVMITRSLLPL
jgi:hypothetical protein